MRSKKIVANLPARCRHPAGICLRAAALASMLLALGPNDALARSPELVPAAQTAAKAANLPWEVLVRGVEFRYIPAGWSYVSSQKEYGKTELARVWVDAFYIATYEARDTDLQAYLNSLLDQGKPTDDKIDEGCLIRRDNAGRFVSLRDNQGLPASGLSWKTAAELTQWMGFRLLSEAEWERAARGEDRRTFPWGEANPIRDQHANWAVPNTEFNSKMPCTHVRSIDANPEGVSPFGIWNMAGNVREFVADWITPDAYIPVAEDARNPKGPETGTHKILKGGRWGDSLSVWLKVSARVEYLPREAFRCNGVRYALDAEQMRTLLAEGKATARP